MSYNVVTLTHHRVLKLHGTETLVKRERLRGLGICNTTRFAGSRKNARKGVSSCLAPTNFPCRHQRRRVDCRAPGLSAASFTVNILAVFTCAIVKLYFVALALTVIRTPQLVSTEESAPNLQPGKLRRHWQAAAEERKAQVASPACPSQRVQQRHNITSPAATAS